MLLKKGEFFIIGAISIIGGIISTFLGRGDFLFLWVIFLGIYSFLYLLKPHLLLIIPTIILTNTFCLIPHDFLQVKGLFKARDIVLIWNLVLGVWLIFRTGKVERIKNWMFYLGVGFCSIILVYVFVTCFRYSYPFLLSFRVSRDYFYLLLFFIVLSSLTTKQEWEKFFKIVTLLTLILVILFIIQALAGGKVHIFRGMPLSHKFLSWGVPLARSYAPLGISFGIGFALWRGMIEKKEIKWRIVGEVGLVLVVGAIILTFSRTIWYKMGVTGLVIILGSKGKWKEVICSTIRMVGYFFLFFTLIGMIKYNTPLLFIEGILKRTRSGIEDVKEKTGTFKYRVDALKKYYSSLSSTDLLFGKGFLHKESEVTKYLPFRTVIWGDSAFVTILNSMGWSGVILNLLLSIGIVLRGRYILTKIKSPVGRGVIIGLIGTLISEWVGCFTLMEMAFYNTIAVKGFFMGIIEVIYQVEHN